MPQSFLFKYKYLAIPILSVVLVLSWFNWKGVPRDSLSTSTLNEHGESRSGPQVYYGPRNSLAVLPFTDLSPQQDRPYRPDGFASELIRGLVQVPALQLTARNSSFFFRGEPESAVIGERLQAAHLLAGSFNQDGDRLIVEVRLFSSPQNHQVWSQTYDFSDQEIDATQQGIIAAILDEMKLQRPAATTQVTRMAASQRELYLQGLYQLEMRSFDKAKQFFEEVLKEEPDQLSALLGLVQARLAVGEEAQADLDRALALKPDSPQALVLQSYVQYHLNWAWQAAAESAQQAVDGLPGDASLLAQASLSQFSLGNFAAAGELIHGSIERDPLNLHSRLRLGLIQEFSSEFEDALSTYRVIQGMNPDYPGLHAYRTRVKVLQDKPDSALEESEKETDPFWSRYARILALVAGDSTDEALPLLEQMIAEDGERAACQVAELFAYMDNAEESFAWLERAREYRDGGLAELVGNALFKQLHDDPRWNRLLESLGPPLDGPP